MKVIYTKQFIKSFNKLSAKQKTLTEEVLVLFMRSPFERELKNHKLSGPLKGLCAFSVSSDIRVIFREEYGYTLVFLINIGTHNQVY